MGNNLCLLGSYPGAIYWTAALTIFIIKFKALPPQWVTSWLSPRREMQPQQEKKYSPRKSIKHHVPHLVLSLSLCIWRCLLLSLSLTFSVCIPPIEIPGQAKSNWIHACLHDACLFTRLGSAVGAQGPVIQLLYEPQKRVCELTAPLS